MPRRLIGAGSPSAQDVLDAGIGSIGEMRAVGMIHRHDVRHERRANIIVVVGNDANELRAFDQKA